MAIAQAQIGTSIGDIHTSTNNSATTVIFLVILQVSMQLFAYAVASGGTAGATNQIIKDLTIAGGDTYIMNAEKLVLSNGDKIPSTQILHLL